VTTIAPLSSTEPVVIMPRESKEKDEDEEPRTYDDIRKEA